MSSSRSACSSRTAANWPDGHQHSCSCRPASSPRWPAVRADMRRRAPVLVAAAVAAALVLVLNGLVNGWPPYWERLPGPYQVAGAERSVGPEQVASADWAMAALGPGNRFATDEGDVPVLGGYGDQT